MHREQQAVIYQFSHQASRDNALCRCWAYFMYFITSKKGQNSTYFGHDSMVNIGSSFQFACISLLLMERSGPLESFDIYRHFQERYLKNSFCFTSSSGSVSLYIVLTLMRIHGKSLAY